MEDQNMQQGPTATNNPVPETTSAPQVTPTASQPVSSSMNNQFSVQSAQTATDGSQQALTQTPAPANVPPVSMEEKLFGMFSYIILVSLFTLLMKPKSAFVRLHGRQGLVMSICFFLSFFVIIIPFIGAALTTLIVLAIFGINIFSMYQALMGNWWKIPAIGDIAEHIPMKLFEKASNDAVEAITGNIPESSNENNQEVEDQNISENNPPSATPPAQPS